MMRMISRGAFLMAVLAAALPVAAQTTVALIDVQRVVSESDPGKEAFQKLKDLQDKKLEQGRSMQAELDALKDQFNKQRLTLADDKLEQLSQQIEEKTKAMKRFSEDADDALKDARRKELAQLEEKIMPIVNQIGAEKGLTLIFDKFRAGLLYADSSVDITDEVIKRFNTSQ